MKAAFAKNGEQETNGFDGVGYVRSPLNAPSVMEAKDRAVPRAGEQTRSDGSRRKPPISRKGAPHDAGQPVKRLSLAQPEPTHAVRRTKQRWRSSRNVCERVLRKPDFSLDELGRFKVERRVRLGMIADFVTGCQHRTGNSGQTAGVHPAVKKSSARTVAA